jgi:hypothetical protein
MVTPVPIVIDTALVHEHGIPTGYVTLVITPLAGHSGQEASKATAAPKFTRGFVMATFVSVTGSPLEISLDSTSPGERKLPLRVLLALCKQAAAPAA